MSDLHACTTNMHVPDVMPLGFAVHTDHVGIVPDHVAWHQCCLHCMHINYATQHQHIPQNYGL